MSNQFLIKLVDIKKLIGKSSENVLKQKMKCNIKKVMNRIPSNCQFCPLDFQYVAQRNIQNALDNLKISHLSWLFEKEISSELKKFLLNPKPSTLNPQPVAVCVPGNDNLAQCPMSLMDLICPFELSNQAFITCMSLCLGVPIPHTRIFQRSADYAHIDDWSDFLLAGSAHASGSRHT